MGQRYLLPIMSPQSTSPDSSESSPRPSHDPITSPLSALTLSTPQPYLPNPGPLAPLEQTSVPAHRSHSPANNQKRSDPFKFGSRYLEDNDDPFEFNAWDHVNPDAEYLSYADAQYDKQRQSPVSDFDRKRFNNDPEKWWNLFYTQKKATFFRDRKWLKQEFPILAEVSQAAAGPKVVLEVGAGAGNTAFPLIDASENTDLRVHAYDFSKKAVEVMRSDPRCDGTHMRAEVWDVATTENSGIPPGLEAESVDVVVMIFIFSALNPEQWQQTVRNIYAVLKPGGTVLFRDYGRGDLAQVRFKSGRWMAENFYVRGDGTRVYFFERDELVKIWSEHTDDGKVEGSAGGFEVVDLGVDRRLIVNRQRRLKMYRCWIQGRFRKPG